MSSPSPGTVPPPSSPAPTDKPADKPADNTVSWDSVGNWLYAALTVGGIFAIIFHIGAGYLSYQKYGSILWAILDTIFAAFYYPFYAYFLASSPPPQSQFMGGRRRR
jgi:hypothetical protein